MSASLVSQQQIKYDSGAQILLAEYVVDFTSKPQKTFRRVIHRVAPGSETAMLTRHGAILVDSLNRKIASAATDDIETSDDVARWSDLPDGDEKRVLAQTSVRQAADYTSEVQNLMSDRSTRTRAATPATQAYDLLKKIFPEILTWGLSGAQIEQYLNVTTEERQQLQVLWTFQDANRAVMADLRTYLEGLPVAVVESPVDVDGPSPRHAGGSGSGRGRGSGGVGRGRS